MFTHGKGIKKAKKGDWLQLVPQLDLVKGKKVVVGDSLTLEGKVFTCTKGGKWEKSHTILILTQI